MEQRNNEQNSVIFSVAEIIGKMSNQVNFLIRNHKLMNQLDVDMLMENTRKLYDALCSVRCYMDTDSIPMEVTECVEEDNFNENIAVDNNSDDDFDDNSDEDLDDNSDEDLDDDSDEVLDDDSDEVLDDDSDEDLDDDSDEVFDDSSDEDLDDDSDEDLDDDSDEVFDDDSDEDLDDSSDEDNIDEIKIDFEIPLSTPASDEGKTDSGIRSYKKSQMNAPHTIGDILEMAEDNSLAARLQRKPVTDLMNAIGINDKFLLLNELFGGSMEKYNKSIRALNNFSTLLGAKTYMSELQIELQWDCDSDAYRKLDDLVERRFISVHNS